MITRYRLSAEINRQAQLARDIARAQIEITTGKRLQAPSDDPTGSAQISGLARVQAQEATWLRNLEASRALADRADTTLTNVANKLERAMELLVAGASDTLSNENRAIIADELSGIAIDVATLADSRDPRGGELFSTGPALQIPVSAGGTVTPVASRADVFGNIATSGGPMDLVAIISAAAAAVAEPDPTLRHVATDDALAAMKQAVDHIAAARGEQGVRANRIDSLHEELELSALQLNEQRSAIEGTDIAEVVARLQSKQLSLQAAQAVFTRIGQNSLFDLIR